MLKCWVAVRTSAFSNILKKSSKIGHHATGVVVGTLCSNTITTCVGIRVAVSVAAVITRVVVIGIGIRIRRIGGVSSRIRVD